MRTASGLFAQASILIGAAFLAGDARAGATVDLLFVGRNAGAISATDTVTATPGDTLTMAVLLRNDEPLVSAFFSLGYDLDGDDELDVISAIQWAGVPLGAKGSDFFAPVYGLDPITATLVGSFQGYTTNLSLPRTLPPADGPFAGGYQLGTVFWQVNAGVNTDGADIVPFIREGIDGFLDALLNSMDARVLFNAATVNVPEPGTASLLGLALLWLVLAKRRRHT